MTSTTDVPIFGNTCQAEVLDVLQIASAKQAEPLLFLFNPAVHAGASDVTPRRTCWGISICNRSEAQLSTAGLRDSTAARRNIGRDTTTSFYHSLGGLAS